MSFLKFQILSKLEDISREMLVLMLQRVSPRVSGFPLASPCLWVKLQNLSFSQVTQKLVMWFCVAGVALRDFTLRTLHSALHTQHSALCTPHSTVYSPHFTLHTLLFTLHPPHFTLYTPHSALLRFTLGSLHATLHFSLDTPFYTPHLTLHT